MKHGREVDFENNVKNWFKHATLCLSREKMNVDGLPLTSSSKSSLWPILISFVNVQHLSKIVILV